MTPKNNEVWEARDSESIAQEFEYYFYNPDPDVYSIEGSHAVLNSSNSMDESSK